MLETSSEATLIAGTDQNVGRLIQQLKEAGVPIVLTINGKAELVIHDATSYQKLLELVERIETIAGIRAGLDEMKAGKGRPAAEFFIEFEREFNIPAEE